ncbi:MAG: hypothetical protein WCT24_03700 [Patescibacteria group bacterium]
MMIKKSTGEVVAFDEQKVRTSIQKSGADVSVADAAMQAILPQVHDGMTTAELYAIVRAELKKIGGGFAGRYSLKKGIIALGPSGFPFEKYVAAILRAYGYTAQTPEEDIQGSCVWHEVDVLAQKDGREIFCEAKFRTDFLGLVHLKDVMATYARYLDLVDGSVLGHCPHFTEAWILTNGRFTDRGRAFGPCKGMKLTGWNFPKEETFASLVDHKALYPITVLETAKKYDLDVLLQRGLVLCHDIVSLEAQELAQRIGIDVAHAEELIAEAGEVVRM